MVFLVYFLYKKRNLKESERERGREKYVYSVKFENIVKEMMLKRVSLYNKLISALLKQNR